MTVLVYEEKVKKNIGVYGQESAVHQDGEAKGLRPLKTLRATVLLVVL